MKFSIGTANLDENRDGSQRTARSSRRGDGSESEAPHASLLAGQTPHALRLLAPERKSPR
jgi:hypothetical protein